MLKCASQNQRNTEIEFALCIDREEKKQRNGFFLFKKNYFRPRVCCMDFALGVVCVRTHVCIHTFLEARG